MAIEALVLTGMGVPPFSVRGAVQTLEPIDGALDARRTMNGVLVNVGNPDFLKYASTISCEDIDTPAIDAVKLGVTLTVECLMELSYLGALPLGGNNSRPAVTGSARAADGYVFYRPVMTMMVVGHTVERDPWGKVTSWQLDLEEV